MSDGYDDVTARVHAAATAAGRDPTEITLVAVSKGRSVDQIAALYDRGHRDFGENRAQELAAKAPQLPDDIRWHFVGSLQRRKVPAIEPHVALLHSMDRLRLAQAWQRGADPAPPALLQVNLQREPQKGGVDPDHVDDLVDGCTELGIDLRGLMIIPPIPDVPTDSLPWFNRLRALRDRLRQRDPALAELSMGMTDDYEVAIAAGATLIRVGRAIFGPVAPDEDPRVRTD